MRTYSLIICILILLILSSFNAKHEKSIQIEMISLESDGYISIKIWNPQKGTKYKLNQARRDAVYAILYSGLSGVNGLPTQKPILNSDEDRSKFRTIEHSFFSKNGKWIMFTRTSNAPIAPNIQGKLSQKSVYQITISKNELRKYLEEQNVIKSLNQGF